MKRVHTLVLGSGAAGLNAAVQLRAQGVDDVTLLTDGLDRGTSINTGSDKQTYYKLSLCGPDGDSPTDLAQTLFEGGSMHGDLALVEAALSVRGFLHLVQLGMPFPRDAYGQFVGYKTDHDPRRRATSIGPYTSRAMCEALIRRVRDLAIPVTEGHVAVELLTVPGAAGGRRAAGLLTLTPEGGFEPILCENLVFAVGGPGGLYATSVYPPAHTGGIGLALRAGAAACNLAESQFGIASTAFRWNVPGTYMQVVPRFVSTAADGVSDPRDFLSEAVPEAGLLHSLVFRKGYQWPFDVRKARDGSSLIDLLVYIETVRKNRRVFLDYRADPAGFDRATLDAEAREYLERSGATQPTPLARLLHMNPGAVSLYRRHGIDLAREPLEVAVCAQHNNGGLAANRWWQSTNIERLFPVGEVNGTHGVTRPGGSALNAGQVGGFRLAEFIAHRGRGDTLDPDQAAAVAERAQHEWIDWSRRAAAAPTTWTEERATLQRRMTREAAHVRNAQSLPDAIARTDAQWRRLLQDGCRWESTADLAEACRTLSLCFAARAYLAAIDAAIREGTGSRGSALVLDPRGEPVHPLLGPEWIAAPEQHALRDVVHLTHAAGDRFEHIWEPCRPIPRDDPWFETAWAAFREARIYDA